MLCAPSYSRKHEGITTDWNHSTFFFDQTFRKQIRRVQLMKFFEALPPCPVAHRCSRESYRTGGAASGYPDPDRINGKAHHCTTSLERGEQAAADHSWHRHFGCEHHRHHGYRPEGVPVWS